MREIITLQCPDCKERNYSTTKNKKKTTGAARVFEVLQPLPQAHGPQGNQVAAASSKDVEGYRGVSSTVKLLVSKTGLGGSNPSAPASFFQLYQFY